MPESIDNLAVWNDLSTLKRVFECIMHQKSAALSDFLSSELDEGEGEPSHDLENLTRKVEYVERDWLETRSSFLAGDCVKNKAIHKKTLSYVVQYYGVRMIEIIDALIPNLVDERFVSELTILSEMKRKFVANGSYSVSRHPREVFRNPLPECLFFSQSWCNPFFSCKSSREGVSGLSIQQVSDRLQHHVMPADYLRVKMYFAPFHGMLQPFAYNNRTWAAFSKARVDALRIVPVMPTQDLLNRVLLLEREEASDLNMISEEETAKTIGKHRPEQTRSLRPGRY